MDFVEGLPLSEGCNVIMVVVDRFTKIAHFVLLRHPFTTPSASRLFVDLVVKLYGMPQTITCDRDRIFTSSFRKLFVSAIGDQTQSHNRIPPVTDGQSERVNQCLEMFLRCSVQDAPRKWRRFLPLAEFRYNSYVHTSIGCSPFQALHDHEPNFGAIPELDPDPASPVSGVLAERATQLAIVKKNLEHAQARMKVNADKHRVEHEIQVGKPVLLRLQPYAQASEVNHPFPKLSYKFFGPYPIIERIGKVVYRLELSPTSQLHNVFPISQLKEYRADYTPMFTDLPKLPTLDVLETGPELILDRKLVKKGNVPIPQVLIKCTNLPADAATWEDWETLKLKLPAVLTWGQASSSQEAV